MHTIIHPLNATISTAAAAVADSTEFRNPHYDCREQARVLTVDVYVPGVEASGVEITQRGPDLIVTARKSHFIRVNWQSLHLESAQRDYQLRLRIGAGFDFESLKAELVDGILTIRLPKQAASVGVPAGRHRRVA